MEFNEQALSHVILQHTAFNTAHDVGTKLRWNGGTSLDVN
jgi:hypothetical protein